MAMPGVAEAAVIAIPDAKWQERPLACVVLRPKARRSTLEDVRAHLEGTRLRQVAAARPRRAHRRRARRRASGKFDKKVLRARFG